MLKIRQRKGSPNWYIRGTVKVGQEARELDEHSTGCRERETAESYRANLQARIEKEILYGDTGGQTSMTYSEAAMPYLNKPTPPSRGDVWRVGQLAGVMGDCLVSRLNDGWKDFKVEKCVGLAPASIDRYRKTLLASVNFMLKEEGLPKVSLPTIEYDNERLRWLAWGDADKLTLAYVKHVIPIIITFRFQGCRTQEGLQLQFPDVDLKKGTMWFGRTKNKKGRMVPMDWRVWMAIYTIWVNRGRPTEGHVFLNRLGKPYADTREYKLPGGNPLAKAHATALKRAGVTAQGNGTDFRVHDWRHHWASWCVMKGVDLITIKKLGGWKSLRMVERYATVGTEHEAEMMARVADHEIVRAA